MHGIEKRTVYIIRSETDSSRFYVGITNNVNTRLDWHNHGPCGHTLQNRPWSLVVSMEFPTERAAVRF
jgi:putative endonuclease